MKGGRHHRQVDGTYHIAGNKFELLTGSRAQVWHGTAHATTGGLTKSKLMQNKNGRIVSKRMSSSAKKNNHLVKTGWVTQKGKFGSFQKKSSSPQKKGSKKKGSKKK